MSERGVAAARTWLGTPGRHQGQLTGAAVDCGGPSSLRWAAES